VGDREPLVIGKGLSVGSKEQWRIGGYWMPFIEDWSEFFPKINRTKMFTEVRGRADTWENCGLTLFGSTLLGFCKWECEAQEMRVSVGCWNVCEMFMVE